MFPNKVIFIVSAIVAVTCNASAFAINDNSLGNNLTAFQIRVRNGVGKVFSSGIVDELQETLNPFDLHNLFLGHRHTKYYNRFLCAACAEIGDEFINVRRDGATREDVYAAAKNICVGLHIQPEIVCTGVIDLNIDILLSIADSNLDLDGSRVCSVVFQFGGCEAKVKPTWEIDLHEAKTVPLRKNGSGDVFNILHFTDIHYDPLFQEGSLASCPYPMCCQVDSGSVEDNDNIAGYWTDYNSCDVPDYLLDDTLKQISLNHELDYVYFTGDIISHRVWATDIYNNTKDIKYVFRELRKYFSDTTLFPILGNHEPHPVNNWAPNGMQNYTTKWVFDLVAEEWAHWLGEECKETIRAGGYYTKLVRPGFRVVALNSNVAYVFNWWLLYDDVDNFKQLQWLNDVLFEAEKNSESVHILSHVPTGDQTAYAYWQAQYIKILLRYQNIITGIFNGHTHFDELIVYHNDNNLPVNVVAFNGGSLTPYSGLNPNYRILKIDAANFDIIDYDQYTFYLQEANKNLNKSPEWFKQYSFKEAYGVESLSGEDIANLVLRMAEEPKKILLKKYINYRYRDGPQAYNMCDEDCMKEILCAMVKPVYGNNGNCAKLMDIWQYQD